jgi:hypothetical protein
LKPVPSQTYLPFVFITLRAIATGAGLWTGTAMARQPVEYSHQKHIALGLYCLDCHSGADVRAEAGIPSVKKCMLCHRKLGTNHPEVKKVIAYAAQEREIPWERVYEFDPKALVRFQHAPHYQAHIDCSTCHGDLTRAALAEPVERHTMGTCLDCHRRRNAPQDCLACHG